MRRLVPLLVVAAAVAPAACSDGAGPAAVGRRSAPPATTAPPTTVAPPVALAAELATAEAGIRDPATPEAEVRRLGELQQRAYGRLGAHPEWQDEVAGRLPPALRPVVEANAGAEHELAALHGPVPAGSPLPRWRIVAPDPPPALLAHYRAAAAATGVGWQYLAAIHLVETRMGRIRGDSSAGAQGPMQFIPDTWRIYGQGGDIQSTRDSIHAAARLLRANGAPADMRRALFSYNPDIRYVRAVAAYAELMRADERAYLGYHAWQVYYAGRLLPEGTVVGG